MQTYSTKPASILADVITDILAEGWAVVPTKGEG